MTEDKIPPRYASDDLDRLETVWANVPEVLALVAELRELREENASLRAISGRAGIG